MMESSDLDPALCPAIQFMNVLSRGQTPSDYTMAAMLANRFYNLNVTKLGLPSINAPNPQFNFTPIPTIT
jgi:hypothetical protein